VEAGKEEFRPLFGISPKEDPSEQIVDTRTEHCARRNFVQQSHF
jgi:hypothetical protein